MKNKKIELHYTKKYEKDVKRCVKRGYDMKKLARIHEILSEKGKLPSTPPTRAHNLTGNWAGCIDAHIESDWVIIYEPIGDYAIKFHRTGTHSDLF